MAKSLKKYDVIIVGAGPAGLMTAHYLAKKSDLSILLAEKGRDVSERSCYLTSDGQCLGCQPCNIVYGVGGAGGFSGGKLYLMPAGEEISGKNINFSRALNQVREVFELLNLFAVAMKSTTSNENVRDILQQCKKYGIDVKIYSELYYAGAENIIDFTKKFVHYSEKAAVKFELLAEIESIRKESSLFKVVIKNKESLHCRWLIIAVGKGGRLFSQLRALGVEMMDPQPYFGVRIEIPSNEFEPFTALGEDPKLITYTESGEKIKTHCVTRDGYTICCKYEDFTLVDGVSFLEKSKCSSVTSFNVIARSNSPLNFHASSNLLRYINEIGGGKPLIQRYVDLLRGRKTIELEDVSSSLKIATPCDINLAYPRKILNNIMFFLEKLGKIIPLEKALVYAPVAEWIIPKSKVNEHFETSQKGLYVIGDGSGYTQGIVSACITAILASENIVRERKLDVHF